MRLEQEGEGRGGGKDRSAGKCSRRQENLHCQPHRAVLPRRRPVLHRPPCVRTPVAPHLGSFTPAKRGEEGGADSGARGAAVGEGDGPRGAVDGDEEGASVEVQRHPQRLARTEPAPRHHPEGVFAASRRRSSG